MAGREGVEKQTPGMGDREDKTPSSPTREEDESVWMNKEIPPPRATRIKPEPAEDIKAYAETTMNELLGWYGYADAKVGSDTTPVTLTSGPPPSSSSSSSSSSASPPNGSEKDEGGEHDDINNAIKNSDTLGSGLDGKKRGETTGDEIEDGRTDGRGDGGEGSGKCGERGRQEEEDTVPSQTKQPCPDFCFPPRDTAFFKRGKVCDWCKHVRHGAVNFMDFEGTDRQVQLCSEKCLSQYKMTIFCRETQQHLSHLQTQEDTKNKEQSSSTEGASPATLSPTSIPEAESTPSISGQAEERILITPDLWFSHQTKNASSSVTNPQRRKEKEVGTSRDKEASKDYGILSVSKEEMMAKRLSDKKWMTLPLAADAGTVFPPCTDRLQETLEGSRRALAKEEKKAADISVLGEHQVNSSATNFKDNHDLLVTSEAFQPAHTSMLTRSTASAPASRPQENGKRAQLASLGSTLPCSSLAYPQFTDRRHDKQKFHHNSQAKIEEGKCRTKKGEGILPSSVSSPQITTNNSKSPSCRVAPIEKVSPPFLPPPHLAMGVPAFNGHRELPQAVPLHPLMLGFPHFACPPGLLVPDPALMMGGYLGVQDLPPPHLLHPFPPPSPLLPLPQEREREVRQGGEDGVPMSSSSAGLNAGVPPVTLMVPFPLPLPIPVPIPLPFPVAPEKIQQFFKKQERAPSTQTASPRLIPVTSSSPSEHLVSSSFSPSDKGGEISGSCEGDRPKLPKYLQHYQFLDARQKERHSEPPSPYVNCCTSCQPDNQTAACCVEDVNTDGVCSVSSAMQSMRDHQIPDSFLALTTNRLPSDSELTAKRDSTSKVVTGNAMSLPQSSPKRSHSPVLYAAFDLRKRARLSENRQPEDEAIDLTKNHRSLLTPSCPRDLSLMSRASPVATKSASSKENPNGCQLVRKQHPVSGMSQVHIIDSNSDPPPLAQPFLLPPTRNPNSVRRSLILDAPSVAKPSATTSSLERRYIRTVPAEMVEAAKRRCMRARIRTK